MEESNLVAKPSPELFQLCAAHPYSQEYWEEFVRRFKPLLARSIVAAWRRNGQGSWPPDDLAYDLLQDVYLSVVKNDFRLLRNFRGQTEAEAEAYLAHAAINQTISFLRARHALRRSADEVPLEALLEEHGELRPAEPARPATRNLTEGELIAVLKKCFDGPNGKRDIMIFLLYASYGYSPAEIAALGMSELKETSIANLLGQMKTRLKKYLSGPV
ncbi:MAG TPA: sigma-70 family RNA polymerase sigma factor [Blastocatellia bacterium]|nr:sigma-70 family RNA polymerase sigma factor [Blastocatellia bacterium]